MIPYLKLVMEACAAKIINADIVPKECVFVDYSPNLAQKIIASVSKLNIAVLIHNARVNNNGDDRDPDQFTASFTVEVAANIVTSNYVATEVSESIMLALHKYIPQGNPSIPYNEILAKSLQTVGEGVCELTFSFPYIEKQ